jgi:hypothetical protein
LGEGDGCAVNDETDVMMMMMMIMMILALIIKISTWSDNEDDF